MTQNFARFSCGLVAIAMCCNTPTAQAALAVGDPVGTDYKITAIDAGVTVDFAAHAVDPATSNTIGKLTITLNHTDLQFLGFTLKQNGVATADSSEGGGLRLLLDVKDTNGMAAAWTDYHIRATDRHNPIVEFDNVSFHSNLAHFHDSPTGFSSTLLVVQAPSNNVTQLNYGLGAAVNPGAMFTASNILLHERTYNGFQREFTVDFAPSVPEPTSFTILLGLCVVAGSMARYRHSSA